MIKFRMPQSRCSRNLKAAPTKPCPLALQRLKHKGGCEWFIKDKDSNYCFWYYMYKHQREHSVTEVSKLWNCSVNNISIAERTSISKLLKILKP